MDEKLLAVLIGSISGMIGYWFTTFWMKPILSYRELRNRVLVDMIYYAQVINPEGLKERLHDLWEERIESNRKCSAELSACILELPFWYKWWLKCKGHQPERAAVELIGFSNTYQYEAAEKRVERIKKWLKIKSDRI
ncbi:MAG: hypothetical protein AB7G68_06640 [Nitrospiraceae bacterium]